MNQYQLFSFSEINFALMRNDPARFFSSNIILRRILTVLLSHPSFRLPILKIITSFLPLDRFPLASARDCSIISFILSGEILLYRRGTPRFQIYPEKYACRVRNDFSKMFIFSQRWTKDYFYQQLRSTCYFLIYKLLFLQGEFSWLYNRFINAFRFEVTRYNKVQGKSIRNKGIF